MLADANILVLQDTAHEKTVRYSPKTEVDILATLEVTAGKYAPGDLALTCDRPRLGAARRFRLPPGRVALYQLV